LRGHEGNVERGEEKGEEKKGRKKGERVLPLLPSLLSLHLSPFFGG
jgi:hypothetical protein